MAKNQQEAHLALKDLLNSLRPAKGVPYAVVGLGFGLTPKHHRVSAEQWGSAPLQRHQIPGLLAHHEKMSIGRIRWHIENYDDLINGVRPMMLLVDGENKYIVDGCHRTAALHICGIAEFDYLTINCEQ